jgi:hypothetical protein
MLLRLACLAVLLFATAVAPARAAEDCIQCKHVDCLKGLIRQKTALADGYDALAAKWSPLVKVDGKPADVVNFNSIVHPVQRDAFYREMLRLLRTFGTQEDDMASAVGPPSGCGFTPGLGAETDTFEKCSIDSGKLRAAQAQAPCRQIAELIARHEDLHRTQCLLRKNDPRAGQLWPYRVEGRGGEAGVVRYFPPLMQTPAAHAREEASAYRMEVAALRPLLEKAEKRCGIAFEGVTISCHLPGGFVMGQDISGRVCGNPVTESWTIHTVSWSKGPGGRRNVDPPWKSDCAEAGSEKAAHYARVLANAPANAGGWTCVYTGGEHPTVTIRDFPPAICNPSGEQTVTVPARKVDCTEEAEAAPEPPPSPPIPVS